MSSITTDAPRSARNTASKVSPKRTTAKTSLNRNPNKAEGELFSPTSAAALALSTLHQHGTDRNKRPEDLKGTRLFNQAEIDHKMQEERQDKVPEAPNLIQPPVASPAYCINAPPANGLPPLPPHYPPPPPGYRYAPDPRYSLPPGASPWPPAQYHQYQSAHINTPNVVGPSPTSNQAGAEVGTYHNPNYFLLQNARASPSNGMSIPSPPPGTFASIDPKDKPYARAQSQTSLVTPTPKKPKTEKKGGPQTPGYSRKKKSLGVLAKNFLNQYKEAPRGSVIIVDEAAVKLGVERRRIYDVVNILEAIQLVCKKQKNTYTWMGMAHLDAVFGRLQANGIEEHPEDAKKLLGVDCMAHEREENPEDLPDKTKEFKSLARLSQDFLQVFLVGHLTLSLPEASNKIQGATSMEELVKIGQGRSSQMGEKDIKAAAARGLKTKIRRLYDIANVFLSVGLLKKVDSTDSSRRPNFSWCYKNTPTQIYNLYHDSEANISVTPYTSVSPSPTQDGVAEKIYSKLKH